MPPDDVASGKQDGALRWRKAKLGGRKTQNYSRVRKSARTNGLRTETLASTIEGAKEEEEEEGAIARR